MLKRIKKIWKLSKKDITSIDTLYENINAIPDEDTTAIFISQGSNEEYKDYENEQKGIKGIFNL